MRHKWIKWTLIFACLLSVNSCKSEKNKFPKKLTWAKTFGGKKDDSILSIQQTKEGGYILAGGTKSSPDGDRNAWIINLDKNGKKLWEKTYGDDRNDQANCIQETNDGGYIVAGYKSSSENIDMAFFEREHSRKKQMGSFSSRMIPSKGQTIPSYEKPEDDKIEIPEEAYRDGWVIKLDEKGKIIWEKIIGNTESDAFESIMQTDNKYILVGHTSEKRHQKPWIVVLDKIGNIIIKHDRFYGRSHDEFLSIGKSDHESYIAAGSIHGFNSSGSNGFVAKFDLEGDIFWGESFGGEEWQSIRDITKSTGGGYIGAGFTWIKKDDKPDIWVIKIDENGEKIWEKNFGGMYDDYASSIIETKDNFYLVASYTRSYGYGDFDGYLIKIDDKGERVWAKVFGGTESDGLSEIQETMDGGYIVAGWTRSFGAGGSDGWIIKLDENGECPGCFK